MTKDERRKKFLARQRAVTAAQNRIGQPARYVPKARKRKAQSEPHPVWGSQVWAETRGDDLGESHD